MEGSDDPRGGPEGYEHALDRVHRAFGDSAPVRDGMRPDQLVDDHLGLARHLARLYSYRGLQTDDLEQVAMLGLVLASQRFDPDFGPPFSAFASRTIVGELKRHFRDHAWAVRPTRRGQERYLAVQSHLASMSQELGRTPTVTELATALEMSTEDVIEATEVAHLRSPASLDSGINVDRGGRALSDSIGQLDPAFAKFEDRRLLRRLLEHVNDRDRRVLELVFYEEKTQREAASVIGVSQMQVSRIVTKALSRMRAAADLG